MTSAKSSMNFWADYLTSELWSLQMPNKNNSSYLRWLSWLPNKMVHEMVLEEWLAECTTQKTLNIFFVKKKFNA